MCTKNETKSSYCLSFVCRWKLKGKPNLINPKPSFIILCCILTNSIIVSVTELFRHLAFGVTKIKT